MNAVCIVSAICTNSNPLDYTETRSFFSHLQRYEQSLNSIKKVRETVPNAYIVFIEGTTIPEAMSSEVKKYVDLFFDASIYNWVKYEVEGLYKCRGELASLLAYLTSNDFIMKRSEFTSLSKLSGRYAPVDGFKFNAVEGHILAKIEPNIHHYSHEFMSTVFYTVHINVLDDFILTSKKIFQDEELCRGVALEHIMPMYLKKNRIPLYVVRKTYVGGQYGPWGGYVEH